MTFLVTHAALNGHVAEDRVDGRPQRLAAVQDHEHALIAVQAALDEVGQQCRRDGRVLGGSVPQAERMLDAVGVDAHGDDAAAALELDAVEHHHRQAQVAQRPRHQIDQGLAGPADELAADR